MAGRVLFHIRRLAASHALEGACRLVSRARAIEESLRPSAPEQASPPSAPRTPEDFRPLEHSCFQNPYAFYKLLRDEYPVYRLPNGVSSGTAGGGSKPSSHAIQASVPPCGLTPVPTMTVPSAETS
jgi:hypothetical protein